MNFLIDSNQLMYSANASAPQHAAVRTAFRLLLDGPHPSFVVPQTLTEFWRSATRPLDPQNPARSGLGLTPEEADAAVTVFRQDFLFLPDTEAIFEEWQRIALTYQVRGAQVHDARLAAVMRVYGIDRILTHNVRDFRRYPFLQAVHPDDLPGLLRSEQAP